MAKEENLEQEIQLSPEVSQDKNKQETGTLEMIEERAKEEESRPLSSLNLRTILGGDVLTAKTVRHQIWLFVLIVIFAIIYVAFRYQCQQDIGS